MMKQGYGQTKKPEASSETKPQEETKEAEVDTKEVTSSTKQYAEDQSLPATDGAGEATTPSKPTRLAPPSPSAPTATLAHGQYTPTEEHKSPDLVATVPRDSTTSVGVMTPDPVTDDELALLKKENEVLRRRNEMLMERLKKIQTLVEVREVGVDDV